MDTLFAVAAPGLAPFTAQELHQFALLSAQPVAVQDAAARGAPMREDEYSGVEFSGDRRALYRANLHLRTASRVLVRLGEFEAVGFVELRRRAGRLAWERFLRPGQPIALRVTCHKSRLYHSDAVAERVAGAIGDRLGVAPSVEKQRDPDGDATTALPPQLIVVRLLHDHCTISVDASGDLLHRRGYRLATAKAPLRETLAAGMLLAAHWDPLAGATPAPLLDPFCGAGTIPIEAALLAFGRAPGRNRQFAFMNWPDYDATLWAALCAEADERSRQQTDRLRGRLQILASDRDAGAIAAAQGNAERAGVADRIEFTCRPVSAIAPPPGPGWVVCNPPYGLRVSANRDLRNLYAQFGNVLRERCPGWQVAMVGNDRQLLGQVGLKWERAVNLVNGGIPVHLVQATVE